MKTKIQIKSYLGDVLFEFEKEDNTLKETVVEAVRSRANLFRADLSEANLSRANLSEANLSEAYLFRADLSEADLFRADLSEANLFRADLSEADLSRANLSEANLSEANLSRANLSEANLSRANLSRANLSEANLFRADLSEANLLFKYSSVLNLLKFQRGIITAFKYVDMNMQSPVQNSNKIIYKVGDTHNEKNVDESDFLDCGRGLNVADLGWCLRGMNPELHKLLEVEFTAEDIVAIPFNSDGKFRVSKLKVVKIWTKDQVKKYLQMKIK